MKNKKCVLFFGLVLCLGLLISGCAEDNIEVHLKLAEATGTITGRVLDASTNTAIGDADIILIVNGSKSSTKSSTSTDADLTGRFSFGAVPAGSHEMTISATGYATYKDMVSVSQTYDNTPVTANVGDIGLAQAFTLTVVVTSNGSVISGATVIAMSTSSACSNVSIGGSEEVTAVTGTDGTATLAGLNQCLRYSIVVPALDADGDGVYDYVSASVSYDDSIDTDDTVSIALSEANRGDSISIIASSMSGNETVTYNSTNIPGGISENSGSVPSTGTDDSIILVFNYPVASSTDLSISYVRNLVATTDANYNEELLFSGITGSLDTTGVIMTIAAPTGGYPVNEVVSLNGTVAADTDADGFLDTAELDDLIGDDNIYIENDTSTGLSSSSTLTVDNYNGGAGTGTAYLEFPEVVLGTYRVISYTTGGSTTIVNGDPTSLSSNTVVYADTASRSSAGVVYRVALSGVPVLSDADTVVLGIDASDTVGNRFVTTSTTYTVK